MKTFQPSSKVIKREWHEVDARDEVLGRLATRVTTLLMGKHKASYSPNIDSGDFVAVVNCEKVKLTGKKEEQKIYRSNSGYPGGFKEVKLAKVRKEHPQRIIEHAVEGMLPDNKLRADRMRRLKVLVGERNPYGNKFTKKLKNKRN
jgi:large subunit ribosomal protein L13